MDLLIRIVKPTRCTNVSNLFILERHSTYFERSFRPSSEYKTLHAATGICQTDTAVCLVADCTYSSICLQMPIAACTVLYSDDERKDRPKHVECLYKINKFDTLVHLVGFTTGIKLRCKALWTSNLDLLTLQTMQCFYAYSDDCDIVGTNISCSYSHILSHFFQDNIALTHAPEVHWSSAITPCVAIIVNLR